MKTIKCLAASLAFALVLAGQARAETFWTLLVTESAGGTIDDYKAYYCTKDQAATFFEGANTYGDVAKYLTSSEENYEAGMEKLTASTDRQLAPYSQYETKLTFYKYLETALSGDFIAVVALPSSSLDGKDQVRVFGATAGSKGALTFDPDSGLGGASNWATVPEPTSGMLLLLGAALLALRRKRK